MPDGGSAHVCDSVFVNTLLLYLTGFVMNVLYIYPQIYVLSAQYVSLTGRCYHVHCRGLLFVCLI